MCWGRSSGKPTMAAVARKYESMTAGLKGNIWALVKLNYIRLRDAKKLSRVIGLPCLDFMGHPRLYLSGKTGNGTHISVSKHIICCTYFRKNEDPVSSKCSEDNIDEPELEGWFDKDSVLCTVYSPWFFKSTFACKNVVLRSVFSH